MLLPGVSGGTCAIILGIYDRLIKAVGSLTKDFKNNVLFLLTVLIGGGIGVVCFSWIVSYLLDNFGLFMNFLFMGAVLGTVPIIYRQSGAKGVKFTDLIFAALGMLISVGIALIPKNLLSVQSVSGIGDAAILFAAGFGVAVALVLPGISVSHTLLVIGIYDRFVTAVKTLDVLYVLPVGLGCLVGIFATTGFLDYLMTKYTRAVYMVIGGFVLSSVPQILFADDGKLLLPAGIEWLPCILLFAVGFAGIAAIALIEKKRTKESTAE